MSNKDSIDLDDVSIYTHEFHTINGIQARKLVLLEDFDAAKDQLDTIKKELDHTRRIIKEWQTLWQPIDDLVRPLTPLGKSVGNIAVELIRRGIEDSMELDAVEELIAETFWKLK